MVESRDTQCAGCYKWTHRLTPGGRGLVFCDEYCARRYDTDHHTTYAFDRYKYLAIGDRIRLGGMWIQQECDAWQALLDWKNNYEFSYNHWTLEQAQRMFSIHSFIPGVVFFIRVSH